MAPQVRAFAHEQRKNMHELDDLVFAADAAAYLGCSAQTLYVWRRAGKGPKCHPVAFGSRTIHGYRLSDLDAFKAARSATVLAS